MYDRTLFSHKKSTVPKELTFKENEVFNVIDSYPEGQKNMWYVKRINQYGTEEEEGYIPLDVQMEWGDQPHLTSYSLPAFFRFPLARRLNSSPGPDTFQTLRENQSNITDLYKPVREIKGMNLDVSCVTITCMLIYQ